MNNHLCIYWCKKVQLDKSHLAGKVCPLKAASRLLAINKSHAPHIQKFYVYHNVERSLKMIDIDREYCVKSRVT